MPFGHVPSLTTTRLFQMDVGILSTNLLHRFLKDSRQGCMGFTIRTYINGGVSPTKYILAH